LFNEEFYYWILCAAISPGIIAFSLYTLTIKYLGPSTTGFTLYLYTIYGAFYGIIFFSEILENYHLIGTIFVFFGIYLVRRKSKNEIKA
jgi:drug/metabolite transporter (DMT)-like permease